MDPSFGYSFPAIRGIQAKREYFVSMCPLRLIPKIFLFDEEELVAELRAQRTLNKQRVPEMAQYMIRNRGDYVFSALTASVDAEVKFEPLGVGSDGTRLGVLRIPMNARFIVNDGQHRRAAIEAAMRDAPDLADETIAVVFFLDQGLQRCQQMFADLNRYAIRPSKSLGVLYDHRDNLAQLSKLVVLRSAFFKDIVEMERSTLSPRSRKLFTLSALYHSNGDLLDKLELPDQDVAAKTCTTFWEDVANQMPEWQAVRERRMAAGEVRRDFIHSHGIVLQALGAVGNVLLRESRNQSVKSKLKGLRKIDWSRANTRLWEGRAMIGGRVSKASQNVVLTANVIKKQLGLDLSPEEVRIERIHQGARNGKN